MSEREPLGAGEPTSTGEALRQAQPMSLRMHLLQFIKFSMVGGSGVLVNLAFFNATLIAWQISTGHMGLTADYVANGLGFIVSVCTNYYLNRRWTFRSRGRVATEFSKFVTVSVAAYVVNLGIFTLAHTHFALRGNLSQLIAIASVMPVNYVANKFWSFRSTT